MLFVSNLLRCAPRLYCPTSTRLPTIGGTPRRIVQRAQYRRDVGPCIAVRLPPPGCILRVPARSAEGWPLCILCVYIPFCFEFSTGAQVGCKSPSCAFVAGTVCRCMRSGTRSIGYANCVPIPLTQYGADRWLLLRIPRIRAIRPSPLLMVCRSERCKTISCS